MTSIFGGQEKVRVRRMEQCGTCTGTYIALNRARPTSSAAELIAH
jgi:hypothetical protein